MQERLALLLVSSEASLKAAIRNQLPQLQTPAPSSPVGDTAHSQEEEPGKAVTPPSLRQRPLKERLWKNYTLFFQHPNNPNKYTTYQITIKKHE